MVQTITIGSEIKRLRKQLHLTQAQLCANICTQATISMIEKDEIKPRLEILFLLSIKLNKSISHFANILIDENYDYKLSIENEIEYLTTQQNYELVYEIVKRELSFSDPTSWYPLFLKWNFYLSSYETKRMSIDDCIANLKYLLKMNKEMILKKDYLMDRIYNTIAYLHSMKNEFEKANFYYNKINIEKHFENVHQSPRINTPIYYIRVLYNKAKTQYDMKEYDSSLQLLTRGIELSIQYENMSFLGNFYYYIGLIEEKRQSPFSVIAENYRKAYNFFDILGRTSYMDIIKKEKAKYLR